MRLAVGQSASTDPIPSRSKLFHTRIELVEGGVYTFETFELDGWRDAGFRCTTKGHDAGRLRLFRWFKRFRGAHWLALVGQVGDTDRHRFAINDGRTGLPIEATGELQCFANDAHGFYWNNRGTVRLRVTRTG